VAAPEVITESAVMRGLMADLRRSAATDATVLLVGETGTGKEVLARALHQASARAGRAFVPVNCGALPESIVESELFGNVKGAFTGAGADRAGLFEEASGGTLFLDEVGELPLATQVRLLRALQERRIRRLGEAKERTVDVRLVAATNRDLAAMVKAGTFREDLFFRLQVVSFKIPPLRERREDLPRLAAALLADINERYGRACQLQPEAVELLTREAWPGNVRELRHFLEQLVVLSGGDQIGAAEARARLKQRITLEAKVPAALAVSAVTVPAATTVMGERGRFALAWWRFRKPTGSTTEPGAPSASVYVRPLADLERVDETKALPLGGALTVGRDAERAQLVLPTEEVSRRHATFTVSGDSVSVVDEQSRNGTFVEGQALPPATTRRLAPGDVVRFGKEWLGVLVDLTGKPDEPTRLGRQIAERVGAAFTEATSVDVKACERLLVARAQLDLAAYACADGVLRAGESDARSDAGGPLTAEQLQEALRVSKGNKREAARLLGISPQTLYTKLRAFGLDPK
jgi:DNA-binding NtrC family response regulator